MTEKGSFPAKIYFQGGNIYVNRTAEVLTHTHTHTHTKRWKCQLDLMGQ